MQSQKPSIPKFASFRPKAAEPSQASAKEPEQSKGIVRGEWLQEDKVYGVGSRSKHDRRRSARSSEEHRKHHDRHRSRSPSRKRPRLSKESPAKLVIEEWEDAPDLFVVDKTGDPNNLSYGTIHRYSIPSYYRAGSGRVVGLSSEYRFDRSFDTESFVVIGRRLESSGDGKQRRLLGKGVNKDANTFRVLALQDADASLDPNHDYVPLTSSSSRERNSESNRHDHKLDDENDGIDYRSIEGKAKARATTDEDLEAFKEHSSSEDEGKIKPMTDAARQRNVYLSRRVETDSMNLQAWQELIDHQDSLIGLDSPADGRRATNAERHSIAEVKLSIYEKALTKVGYGRGRESLLLGMMAEGSKVWETKRQVTKWQSILRENAGFIGLWTAYLNFQQTNFITFTYESCRSVFLECLNTLTNVSRGLKSREEHDSIRIYIFMRMTIYMREAGFSEHAVGLWQSILEFNFFRPSNIVEDSQALVYFEAFWDDETPRVGDEGAMGWKYTQSSDSKSHSDKAAPPLDETHLFQTWIASEKQRAQDCRTPARTTDDVGEDDPYRVILFSDLKDFLFSVHCPQSLAELLDALLAFCNLPPLAPSNEQSWSRIKAWWDDAFIRSELSYNTERGLDTNTGVEPKLPPLAEQLSLAVNNLNDGSNVKARSSINEAVLYSTPNFQTTTESLFVRDHAYRFHDYISPVTDVHSPTDQRWVRRLVDLLAMTETASDDFLEYVLGLVASTDYAAAKKKAKVMLKSRPASMRLYNAYALLESQAGNRIAADNVWLISLSKSQDVAGKESSSVSLLRRTLVWDTLRRGDDTETLHLLLSLPLGRRDGNASSNPSSAPTVDGPAMLRAERVRETRLSSTIFDCTDIQLDVRRWQSSGFLDA